MSQLPIGVGDRAAQQRFIEANKAFLLDHPALHRLLEKVRLRTLEAPPQDEKVRSSETGPSTNPFPELGSERQTGTIPWPDAARAIAV